MNITKAKLHSCYYNTFSKKGCVVISWEANHKFGEIIIFRDDSGEQYCETNGISRDDLKEIFQKIAETIAIKNG